MTLVDRDLQCVFREEKNRSKGDGQIRYETLNSDRQMEELTYEVVQTLKGQQRYANQKIKVPKKIDLTKGVFTKNLIAFPISSRSYRPKYEIDEGASRPLIYVQIENRQHGFTKNDEVVAIHYSHYLQAVLEKIFFFKLHRQIKKHTVDIVKFC